MAILRHSKLHRSISQKKAGRSQFGYKDDDAGECLTAPHAIIRWHAARRCIFRLCAATGYIPFAYRTYRPLMSLRTKSRKPGNVPCDLEAVLSIESARMGRCRVGRLPLAPTVSGSPLRSAIFGGTLRSAGAWLSRARRGCAQGRNICPTMWMFGRAGTGFRRTPAGWQSQPRHERGNGGSEPDPWYYPADSQLRSAARSLRQSAPPGSDVRTGLSRPAYPGWHVPGGLSRLAYPGWHAGRGMSQLASR